MTAKFVLWAQALDNASPDHFEVGGEELSPDDAIRREAAVSSVSSVIKSGIRVYEVNGVILTVHVRQFVLEVPSAQRDHAGRSAPIVCQGQYDVEGGDALGDSAACALDDFARRIGRTLQPEHIEGARAAFVALKKKSSTTNVGRPLGIGGLVLVILGIVYWLARGC